MRGPALPGAYTEGNAIASDVTVLIKSRGADGVVTDVKRVSTAADDASSRVGKLGAALAKIGTIAGGVTAANALSSGFGKLQDFIGGSIEAASQLEQSIGGVESVFGRADDRILKFGESAAEAVGLSKNAFNELSAATGAFLQNYGMNADAAAAKTIQLTERAADMAATFGGSVADAMQAIQAGLRGQADPLERYGVALSAAKVEAHALAMTGKTVASSLSDQEKMAARLDLVFQQTAKTQGQFAKEADTTAGKTERMEAKMENMRAELGERLLPLQEKWIGLQLTLAGVAEQHVIPAMDRTAEALDRVAKAWEAAKEPFEKVIGAGKWVDDKLIQLQTFGKHDSRAELNDWLRSEGLVGGGDGDGNFLSGMRKRFNDFAEMLQGGTPTPLGETYTETIKGIDRLGDGLLTMAEAAEAGFSALEAGAIEAFDSLTREQDKAAEKAFEHTKALAKLATMYDRNADAAGRLMKALTSSALDATRNAGSAIFGRPTRESAALELALAQLDSERLGAEGRLTPELDALRQRLADMGSGVDENVANLKRQKAEYDAMLSNLRSLGTATAEEIEWARVQSENYQKLINDAEAQGSQERQMVEARIKAIEDELAAYDRRRDAIQREIEQYNARQRVMEAELQLADKTLLTADEQRKKFEEVLPLMADQSEKYRELSERLGDDLIPEMDLMREKAAAVSEAMRIVSDEKFRQTLIPAIDLAAERANLLAAAKDREITKTREAADAADTVADRFHKLARQVEISGVFGRVLGPFAGALPNYDGGGVVGGPLGAPQLAVVHGGEQVLTPGQRAGGTVVQNFHIHVAGSVISAERDIAGIVQRAARSGAFRGTLA